MAGAKDERFKVLLGWAEARGSNAPTIVPESSNVLEAPFLAQHLYAGLLRSTKTGAAAHVIVDNIPGRERTGGIAEARPKVRSGVGSRQRLLRQILKPPRGKIEHMSALIEAFGGVVRRQDEGTDRQALADDTRGRHYGHALFRIGEAPGA